MGTLQESDIFHGVQFSVDFAASSNLSFKEKQEIRREIVNNGGILSYILTKQTNYLVTSDSEKTLSSYKGKTAIKYGIAVVSCHFIKDCIKSCKVLDAEPYLLTETQDSQAFRSGKISSENQAYKKKANIVKTVQLPDLDKIRVWPYKSPDAPCFNEQNCEIAKDILLQGYDSSSSISSFYALELHVIPAQTVCTGFRCRLFTHSGDPKTVQEGDEGTKECRYFSTLGEALGAYTALYNLQTQAPHSLKRVESVLSHKIGSDKMIQMTISDFCSEEDSILSPNVANLVDSLWNEATGSLSNILSVPVNTIKLEDVEKAEAILLTLRRSLDAAEDASALKKLSDEFFSVIPHKNRGCEIASRPAIAQKQDLCQLIKDMVSIGESTNWLTRRSVYSKYRSLKCHMECLERGSDEFHKVQECVNSSETGPSKINILNIFSICRPVEEATFTCEIENKKLLFHSSKVTNFVGILSRGLLLPKIVVDDFGGKRSDAGMLGSGIYFASSASTSAKYSSPGNHGTRLMLVNEVALGKVKAFRKFSLDLNSPPDGYNSCYGVLSTEDEPSDFKDDEFVIYNGNQQKIRYLVEFVLPGDEAIARDDISLDSGFSDEEMEIDREGDSVDLSDVISVVDPLTKVEAGLKGTGDKAIPLQSVHIRARLLDLAAQVIVFQTYKNSSSSPIEAKYVFPLDDMAAVCGFEAFINDKHIVGEVKEKEQAHKEYREAISQGHGAYLMDEETPDVFTVSVGNLPPGAHVLIKITYVTELLVDGEHICFTLPGSLAPWKRNKALEEITQTDLNTVEVEEDQLRDLTDFSVNVSVEMPFEIRSIDSPTHPIRIKRSSTKAVVFIEPGQSINGGFQLLIGLSEIHVPRMWVEQHISKPNSQACMLTFFPEFEAESPPVVEVVFLVDVSCSMKGSPVEEAKKVLLLCLTHMNKDWIFNIVLFGSKHSELFPCSRRIDDEAFREAGEFIKSLTAIKGSTELWRVLRKLYLLPSISGADHPRNLFLISDGHVTEEETTLDLIRKNCQSDRLFTFGLGSTANRYLLRSMSKAGAGASEFFDSKAKSKWERKVKLQLSKAEQPGLTSVGVTWEQHDSGHTPPVQAPHQLLSLFSGSRQVVYGFVDNCTQAILTAEVNGKTLSTMVSTSDLNITTGKILHQLTARAVIRDWDEGSLHEERTGHEIAKRDRKHYIVAISKEFSVTSKFTSFVAIEHREKDEKFEEGKGPNTEDLLTEENVDILPYIGWEEEMEDSRKRELTTEEKLEKQLKEAKILETCAVLQCERLYNDIMKEAREKLGRDHKLANDAAFALFHFYLYVMGDQERASQVYKDAELGAGSSEDSFCSEESDLYVRDAAVDNEEIYASMDIWGDDISCSSSDEDSFSEFEYDGMLEEMRFCDVGDEEVEGEEEDGQMVKPRRKLQQEREQLQHRQQALIEDLFNRKAGASLEENVRKMSEEYKKHESQAEIDDTDDDDLDWDGIASPQYTPTSPTVRRRLSKGCYGMSLNTFQSKSDSNVKFMANRTSDNDLRYETEPIFKTSAKPKGSSSDQFQVEAVTLGMSLGMSESYERRIATDSSMSHKPCETPSIRKQMNKEVFQESTKSDGVKSKLKTSERAETTSFCVGGEFGLDLRRAGAAVAERSVFSSVFTTKPQLDSDVDSFDQFPEEYTMEVPPQEVQPTGLFGSSLATDGGGLFASSSISQATQEPQPTTLLGQSFAAGKGGYVGFSSRSPPTQKPSPLQPSFFGPAPKGFLFGQLSQAAEKHTHETGPVLTDQKPQAVALASEARPKGISRSSSDELLQDQQITGSCASPIVVGKGLTQPQRLSLPVLPEMSTTTSRKGFSLGQPVAAQAKPVGNSGFSFGSSQISARPLASQVPQIGTGRFGRVSQTGTLSAQPQSASPPVLGAAPAALVQSASPPMTPIAPPPPPVPVTRKGFSLGQPVAAQAKPVGNSGFSFGSSQISARPLASQVPQIGTGRFGQVSQTGTLSAQPQSASPPVLGAAPAALVQSASPPMTPIAPPPPPVPVTRKGFSLGQPVAAQAKPVGNSGFSFGSSQISARPLASQVPQIGTGRFGRVSQTGTLSAQPQSASPPVLGAAPAALVQSASPPMTPIAPPPPPVPLASNALLQSALTPETSIALHPPPPPPPPLASTASLLPPQAPPKPPSPAVMGALPPFCMKGGIRKMKNAGLSSEVSSVKELSEVLRECEAKSMATSSLSLGEGDSHAKKEKKAKDEKSVAPSAEAVEQPEPIQTTTPPFEASPPRLRRRRGPFRLKTASRRAAIGETTSPELTRKPPIQYDTISSKKEKMKDIFEKQKPDGFWEVNDVTVIDVKTKHFLDFLVNAGTKSLGARMFKEVQRLLSTLLVLAFIKFRLSIEIPLALPLGVTPEESMVNVADLAEPYSKDITKALIWIKIQEQKIPLLCTRLEFGANWEAATKTIVQKMCV